MTIEVKLLNDGEGLLFVGSGSSDAAESQYIYSLLQGKFDESKVRFRIWDVTQQDGKADTSEQIRREASNSLEKSKWLPDQIVAIVASESLRFGLARMWESLAHDTNWSTNVFLDMQEAERWICKEYSRVYDEALDRIHVTDTLLQPTTLGLS